MALWLAVRNNDEIMLVVGAALLLGTGIACSCEDFLALSRECLITGMQDDFKGALPAGFVAVAMVAGMSLL